MVAQVPDGGTGVTVSKMLAAALAAATLAGCAGLHSLSCDVSSYGDWPAGRAPGHYAFDRLPSQQAQPAETAAVEAAARPALAKAGFEPVAAGQEPDVLVQVGTRMQRTDEPLWTDPLWWHGGFGYWRHSAYGGPDWMLSASLDRRPRYDHEVAVLLRDRASGKPLFETRATNEGSTPIDAAGLAAMFQAALMDFPKLGLNPRTVIVPLVP